MNLSRAHDDAVLTQFRPIALAAIALLGVWTGQALAQRADSDDVVRLAPSFGGVCEDCDLRGRILAGARMRDSDFSRSNFSSAVLSRADATGARFDAADFTDADLRRAKLAGAHLEGANLSGADLRDAEGLTQEQLDAACGDARTRLPQPLRVRGCD